MATQAQTGPLVQTSDAYVMERNGRSRSLISQITTVLTQPTYFFRTFPATGQWLWVALIILMLVGFSAVRQSELENSTTSTPDTGLQMQGMGSEFGGMPMDPGMGGSIPIPGAGSGGTPSDDISGPTMTAVLAGGNIVLMWLVQAVVLSQVSMLNASMPRLGRNLQIAVWASVPIGVMAALQLLYYAAGGQGGAMGLSLLLEDWAWYQAQTDFTKAVVYSLTSRTTLFWLWSLVLLYLGARHALRGYAVAAFLAVAAWVIIVVLAPVVTGAIEAPQPETQTTSEAEMMLPDGGMMQEGSMPSDEVPSEGEQSGGAIRVAPPGR